MPCTSVNTTLQHATDAAILEFAREHSLVVVSEDTDFGELLAQQRTAAPSEGRRSVEVHADGQGADEL